MRGLSGESDLAEHVKAHNPSKYCTVRHNGLSRGRLWRVALTNLRTLCVCQRRVCVVGKAEEVEIAPPYLSSLVFLESSEEKGVSASARDITDFSQGSPSWFCNRDGEGEGGGRFSEQREKGGGICCHGEGFLKQLLIRLCFSAPLPFFSSLSPLYYRQPFRQEICALRGRLWTFLLQTFYAVRHTQGWETLSSKHRERILAGKEFYSIYGTYYIQAHRRFLMRCVDVSGFFFFFLTLPNPA